MKIVEEFNEFTWDMVRGLPKAYFQKIHHGEVEVHCKKNLSSLYWFADRIKEFDYLNRQNDDPSYTKEGPGWSNSEWTPPPLKEIFGLKSKKIFEELNIEITKPTIVIQNKYVLEWFGPPKNFISVEALDELMGLLKEKYDVIYLRPQTTSKNYSFDDNTIHEFEDYTMIKNKYPEVICAADYPDYDYNHLQFALESTSSRHIAVSGGNACVAAYFGGTVFILDKFCPHGKRPVWGTDSWLKRLSGASIIGVESNTKLIENVKKSWLDIN